MGIYQIGEVCRLLGLRPHIVRYWEKEFEHLHPTRDESGRKLYSRTDVSLLFRVKHLLHEEGYTIEGARKRLFEELTQTDPDVISHLGALRHELISLYLRLEKLKEKTGESVEEKQENDR